MVAANQNLTTVLERNLHVTPRGLDWVMLSVPIFIDTSVHPLAADSYKILTIDAQTFVIGGYQLVQTVELAADTISVGDIAAANGKLAATAVNALGMTAWTAAAEYYPAADEIQITPNAAITVCKFWEIVLLQYLSTT